MQKDSYQLALEWEAANPARCKQLVDALDACPDPESRRVMYATLSKDEKCGVMPEITRRYEARFSPVGSFVTHMHHYGIWLSSAPGTRYFGTALVVGQSGRRRYLLLATEARDSAGHATRFGEADSADLREVT